MGGTLTENNGAIPTEDGEEQDKPGGRLGRRALMFGAAAGLGAAAAVARAQPAEALDGDPVIQGAYTGNVSVPTTYMASSDATGLWGIGGSPSGLEPVPEQGPLQIAGLVGDSGAADGVVGLSSAGNGVKGITTKDDRGGVIGYDQSPGGGFGVQGYTESASGVGVSAVAVQSAATALQVEGVATFTRSGLESVTAGQSSATVTGVPLTASSLVLATMQNSISKVYVAAVIPSVSGSSFKIILTKAVPHGDTAQVGWFVVN